MTSVVKLKVMIAVLIYIMFMQKSDILAYFALVPLCMGGNIQYGSKRVSASFFLVRIYFLTACINS